MGIKVQLQDGMVEVGGDFNSALAWVKGFPGRAYEGATKTWNVPTTLQKFCHNSRFPLDVLSGSNAGGGRFANGNHITKWGNAYSRDEWEATKAADKAEREALAPFAEKFAALDAELRAKAEAISLHPNALGMIRRFTFDNEIEFGAVKFISPEREKEVMGLYEWYMKSHTVISDAQDDAGQAARERVLSAHGIE